MAFGENYTVPGVVLEEKKREKERKIGKKNC
jgi:hypothetical protein